MPSECGRPSRGTKQRSTESPSTESPTSALSRYLLRYLDPPSCARCAVWGAPGSGKTSLLREIVASRRRTNPRTPTIWIDLDPPPGNGTSRRGPWIEAQTAPDIVRIACNSPVLVTDHDLAEQSLRAAWTLGGCLLIVDEAHLLFGRKCDAGHLRLLLEGRRRGISIILATQRPVLLHPTAQNVCIIGAIGTLGVGADSEVARQRFGLKDPLPLHHFRLYNTSVTPPTADIITKPF